MARDLSAQETPWQLWSAGQVLRSIEQIEPVLASWDASHHPAQRRLQAYLTDLEGRLATALLPSSGLYLMLDIDVGDATRLLRHHDLENYLTPVVRRLGAERFVFVSARKQVGGGSRLFIGVAMPRLSVLTPEVWGHFACHAGRGYESTRWKTGLHAALEATNPVLVSPGPVEVQLSWRCSPTRNWSNLWKPTGDTMGPVLGYPNPHRPFNPYDDRIVQLGLHLNPDPSMGHDVDVGMWWRPLADQV